jgi:hypothetical protein
MERTVAANVAQLIGWNRSMAVALGKAERGSQAEDMYFIEKLERTAHALGFVLDTAPAEPPAQPLEHPEDIFQESYVPVSVIEYVPPVDEVGADDGEDEDA